jgi:CRP-like cAMP-binding protein
VADPHRAATAGPSDDLLRKLPLLRRVAAEDRVRIAQVGRLKAYDRGARIFAEGDDANVFVLIVEGRVKIFKATPAGKEIILEIFGAGDPLGAVAVYEGSAFPASAMALEPTTTLQISRDDFCRLLEQHPPLVRGLMSSLTLRVAELTRRLAEMAGTRIETRFARLLLKLAHEVGRPAEGGTFVPVPLTRQELADFTGTTIETAIRIMSRWQKDDVVRTQKDGFLLVDRRVLDDLAQAS